MTGAVVSGICWKPTRKAVVAEAGVVGRWAERGERPRTTPNDTVRARCPRIEWIGLRTRCIGTISIRRPFPYIAVHVKKAPGVGTVRTYIGSLTDRRIIIGIAGGNAIPPRVPRGRACPAGILPLGFGGQCIRPSFRDIARLLSIQTGQEYLNIIPRYLLHRTVWDCLATGSAWH